MSHRRLSITIDYDSEDEAHGSAMRDVVYAAHGVGGIPGLDFTIWSGENPVDDETDEGYHVEIDGQRFTQAQWEVILRYASGRTTAVGPAGPGDSRWDGDPIG